ncbi:MULTISPECIES: SLATT domain-containing protein [unclassified Caballeronia]|uniref:SLATT domain-containing protein n=1 Tax=unclassified Caballeronia TaxID=2646786 RepID=UPI00285B27A8|nr:MULTISPECIES: SLATT domain-containing protein [unclassified Caballeronia]MDR5740675.1 SLATT domain-containing protein [Caballeronia sp. LZ016]MDR5808801.1 SLATT domain-containing protein [Caballeronia sp. LZ019]
MTFLSPIAEQAEDCCEYHPPDDVRTLLLLWTKRAREAQIRHYAMADRLSAYGRRLGLAVIGMTALTGTSSFLSLVTAAVSPELRIVVGMASMGAAVMASLQTFLRYNERADLHRRAGALYGAVRRRLEAMHAQGSSGEAVSNTCDMSAVRDELDRIAQAAPHVSLNSSTGPIHSRRHPDASETRRPPA